MTSKHPCCPRGRVQFTEPHEAAAEHYLGDDEPQVNLEAIYEESVAEVDWYPPMLFGFFAVGDDTPLEEIPEEYPWRGKSRMHPTTTESQPGEESP